MRPSPAGCGAPSQTDTAPPAASATAPDTTTHPAPDAAPAPTVPEGPPPVTDASPGSALYNQLCDPAPRQADLASITGGPWKQVVASTFYIGEGADASNAGISNVPTQWHDDAVRFFGSAPDFWGPRDPDAPGAWDSRDTWYPRTGLCPQNVTLKENPFYVALPTPDYDEQGVLEALYPWLQQAASYLPELDMYPGGIFVDSQSAIKNRWVQIEANGRTAFAQLEDVGPSDETGAIVADYEYVWGNAPSPKNDFALGAGIDLSPAVTDYLGTDGEGIVRWRFVPADQVPDSWKLLVTDGPPDWS